MNLKLLLEQVKQLRSEITLPVVLMGYINPILQYGIGNFCRNAGAAGVDGVILPDLPLRDFNEHATLFRDYDLLVIMLVTPATPDERIRLIDQASSGFLYAVSASSTTGARAGFTAEQEDYFRRLAGLGLRNPVLVGFGISNAATFQSACRYGAGAIVGSAFVSMLRNSANLEADIITFVKGIRSVS